MSDRFNYDLGMGVVAEGLASAGYQILHALGSGAGGQVYKALQRSTGQVVAIKIAAFGHVDRAMEARRMERFRREIAFCSTLYHPDIVRLLDSGELADGSRFAVFEYIPGRTLAELLRDEGMLKVQRARVLMAQALAPLAYAHAKGIAHRDLKPGNIMVTTDGGRDRLKLLDFGISISVNPSDEVELARLTQSHEWLGTPLYAAPEQLRGEPTGAKSDLYAWALIFVECLTGATLVSGNSLLEIMTQQSRPEQHALPAVLANHRLGALLMRVLEKDPARRIGEAQLVQSLLDRISMDGLEDGQGYLREVSPISAQHRLRANLSETVTDAALPAHTEQRQVIALCCRVTLVGSGGLTGAEQIDALLDDSSNLVTEVLSQFEATASSSVGGYSLWYFGVSHVADARLAMRAALEVVNRLETLPRWFAETGLGLAVQIGIHAGPATLHLTEGRRKAVDGTTARIAMDLAALHDSIGDAGPEPRVLVSDDFRQLVARYADLEPQVAGKLVLSWRKEPVAAYRLRGESRATGLPSDRAPFVGRAADMSRLMDAWRKTGAGEGSAMLLEGEPGVGKSRLAAELMMQLEAEGCRSIETRCLQEWQNAALRPLHALVSELVGLANPPDERAPQRLERLLVELGLTAKLAVPLFCSWLSIALPPGYTPLAYSPQKQRQLLHANIADFLLATMSRGAALLVEDLHWADPSTLECLDTLLTKSKTLPALTIMTARPEAKLTWATPPEVISLAGLTSDAATELAASLLPADTTSASEVSKMVLRSDGVPLYLEELAMAQAQQRLPGAAPSGSTDDQVPPSLVNLLTSRLHVLTQSREVAQFAAALGREFSLELLAALHDRDDLSLIGDLEELVSARILVKRLRLESPLYSFRHALIRDAAYESMSADARKRSHDVIAEGLQRKFPALADSQPDILAHHYERAGAPARAMHFWHLAARRASAASAHVEALSFVDKALAARQQLTDPSAAIEEAALLLTRGAVLVATRGYGGAAPDFARIIELAPTEGPALPLAFAARWGVWNFENARCSLTESSRLADELRRLAEASGSSDLGLASWAAVCLSRFCRGRLAEAVAASRSCVAGYDIEQHRGLALQYGDDPRVSSGSFEALAEMIRGRHESAVNLVDEVMAVIDQLGYPAQKAGMHGQAAWLFLQWGGAGASEPDYSRALEHAQAAIAVAHEHGFPFWELYGALALQATLIAMGDATAAPALQGCSDMWLSFGLNLGRCWHLTFVGQAHQRAGAFDEAQQAFDSAVAFCEDNDSRYFEAEARRQRAVFLADPKNPKADLPRALAECWKGAEDAKALGADFWQLACLMTGIKLSPEPNASALSQVASLLETLPKTTVEPPLVREARALVGRA